MAKADKSAKKDKTKGSKTPGKGKRKNKGAAEAGQGVSVAAHPRAAAQVRRAKGLGGIGFFAIAAYLSFKAGVSPDQVALRAVATGIAGYLLAWACSVTIWRHLVLAELRAAMEKHGGSAEGAPAGTTAAAEPGAPHPAGP